VQGFFFSKPLPPAQLAAFVTNAVSTEGAFLLPEGH
jgi:EAL domain-containing protein (putative c-di-GMP-specific phosphodiesterase class I)